MFSNFKTNISTGYSLQTAKIFCHWKSPWMLIFSTDKSLSEEFLLASTNPQYDNRLFIDLPVQYMKTTSSEHGENILCSQIAFCFDIQNNLCTQHELSLQFSCTELNLINNLLSYCGLVDARISTSEKDLPVQANHHNTLTAMLSIITTTYVNLSQLVKFEKADWI